MEKIKVLILEDVADDVVFIENILYKGGIDHHTLKVDSKEEFIKGIKEFKPDVILSDHSLPQFNSIEAHKICIKENLRVPFILVTGAVSEEFAVTCLKLGIDDYILKSNLSRLPTAILTALKQRELERVKLQAMEELKKQNEQILKINKELDSFIYSISHSLRGPLSTVSGLLNLVEKEQTESNPNVKELHHMMGTCVKRLDTTIRQMIDQSRNARLEIDTNAIDIDALIYKSMNTLSYLEGSSSIETTAVNSAQVPFFSDSYRVEVIFNSIMSNAIKYRNPCRVKSEVLIQVICTPDHAVISFKDNGMGISQNSLPYIFNMFYRASDKSDGAGLGLYMVKEFVEKLKGTVTITSIENESTTVTVVLPNMRKGVVLEN